MKNTNEWENGFDLLYQNITSNQAPGLNAYEKSVILTDAEYAIVVALYNGTLKHSFEETEEMTDYLSPLVSQEDCTEAEGNVHHIVEGSKVFELPGDLLFRTLEMCAVTVDGCGERTANVVPVTQDEFWRTWRNPFKGPNASRVLRLSYGDSDVAEDDLSVAKYSELVSEHPIARYTVRYIRKPEPIILCDLEDGLSINGETLAKTCKLPEALHRAILEEAVSRAKAVWTS